MDEDTGSSLLHRELLQHHHHRSSSTATAGGYSGTVTANTSTISLAKVDAESPAACTGKGRHKSVLTQQQSGDGSGRVGGRALNSGRLVTGGRRLTGSLDERTSTSLRRSASASISSPENTGMGMMVMAGDGLVSPPRRASNPPPAPVLSPSPIPTSAFPALQLEVRRRRQRGTYHHIERSWPLRSSSLDGIYDGGSTGYSGLGGGAHHHAPWAAGTTPDQFSLLMGPIPPRADTMWRAWERMWEDTFRGVARHGASATPVTLHEASPPSRGALVTASLWTEEPALGRASTDAMDLDDGRKQDAEDCGDNGDVGQSLGARNFGRRLRGEMMGDNGPTTLISTAHEPTLVDQSSLRCTAAGGVVGSMASTDDSLAVDEEVSPEDVDTFVRERGGLPPSLFCALQRHKHQALSAPETSSEAHLCCSVCLELFEADDDCVRLPCSHTFHTPCIQICFRSDTRCPYCREVVKPPVALPTFEDTGT